VTWSDFVNHCATGLFLEPPTLRDVVTHKGVVSLVVAAERQLKEMIMGNLLQYAIVFLIIALIAAAVGFGGVAGVAMEGARILFWVFLVLFVVSLVANFARRA
jgi:uncharacterized membrane protein YtjA (UPF0391 family)